MADSTHINLETCNEIAVDLETDGTMRLLFADDDAAQNKIAHGEGLFASVITGSLRDMRALRDVLNATHLED